MNKLDIVTMLCEECNGEGFYYVYNAYDVDYKEKCVCEHCKGTGKWFKKVGSGKKIAS